MVGTGSMVTIGTSNRLSPSLRATDQILREL
jgi:hypothetical protein